MDRRNFLRSTGGAAAAAAATLVSVAKAGAEGSSAVAAPALATGTKELRIAISWPDNGKGCADSARRLAQRIETATERRYRFTFVATTKQGIAAVKAGEADAYHASEHDNLESHRAFAYFAGLPGHNGLRASHYEAWLLAGGGQALWDDLAGDFGIKALLAGHTLRSTGLWSAVPMTTLAELAGRKIWAMGLARDVVRGIGAEPSTITAAELSTALQSGRVFAAEGGGAIASYGLGIFERHPHAVGAAINLSGTALSLGFTRTVWDAMSAGDQAVISAVCSAELHTVIAEERAHRQLLLGPLLDGKPEPPRPFELTNAISRVSDGVVAHLAAHDARTQRINASFMAFRRAIGIKPHVLSA